MRSAIDGDHLGELMWRHRRGSRRPFSHARGQPRSTGRAPARPPLGAGRRGPRAPGPREFEGCGPLSPWRVEARVPGATGAGPGPVDPDVLPGYLLLAGGPDEIPFTFQYQLDVQYAVDRLDFGRPEDYESYAISVVRAETAGTRRGSSIAIFATSHADDPDKLSSVAGLSLSRRRSPGAPISSS